MLENPKIHSAQELSLKQSLQLAIQAEQVPLELKKSGAQMRQ